MVTHVVWLKARGLRLELENGRLMVGPAALITGDVDEYIRANRDEIVAALASDDMWEERRRAYGEAYRKPVAPMPAGRCVVCGQPVRLPSARICDRHALTGDPDERSEAA
jgi:hypothetical protein